MTHASASVLLPRSLGCFGCADNVQHVVAKHVAVLKTQKGLHCSPLSMMQQVLKLLLSTQCSPALIADSPCACSCFIQPTCSQSNGCCQSTRLKAVSPPSILLLSCLLASVAAYDAAAASFFFSCCCCSGSTAAVLLSSSGCGIHCRHSAAPGFAAPLSQA